LERWRRDVSSAAEADSVWTSARRLLVAATVAGEEAGSEEEEEEEEEEGGGGGDRWDREEERLGRGLEETRYL